MTNSMNTLRGATRFFVGSTLLLLTLIIMGIPALSYAATFAYVNTAGDVSTVTADTPNIAIMTAPNIHMHSGVLLLDSQEDTDVVGDSVTGV